MNKEAALKYIHFVTGEANAYVPQYTGYMTSNLLANAKLKDFYNKNHTIAPSQIELMGGLHFQEIMLLRLQIFYGIMLKNFLWV